MIFGHCQFGDAKVYFCLGASDRSRLPPWEFEASIGAAHDTETIAVV